MEVSVRVKLDYRSLPDAEPLMVLYFGDGDWPDECVAPV